MRVHLLHRDDDVVRIGGTGNYRGSIIVTGENDNWELIFSNEGGYPTIPREDTIDGPAARFSLGYYTGNWDGNPFSSPS